MTGPSEQDATSEDLLRADDARLPVLFGAAYPQMVQFANLLADEGVKRGLIGPREVPRLWERHLVNSAAVAAFLPTHGTVVDIGSGAGLPGVVLAAMRPDLHVVLLEPMERRATWLLEVVGALGLDSAEVVRGRAEELHGHLVAEVVTARAVAPMDRLATWSLPLLSAGGVLLAMKGSRATDEVAEAAATITALGGGPAEILDAPTGPGLAGTRVVRVVREHVVPALSAASVARTRASAKKSRGVATGKTRTAGAARAQGDAGQARSTGRSPRGGSAGGPSARGRRER